jgi:chromosome segregation ATPase
MQDQLRELENRLRTTVSSLARATAELETERGERRRSEQRAATLAGQMQQLHEELKSHLAAEQNDHQRLTELERQLREQGQQNNLTVAELQSALRAEQCERQRLEAELLRSRADSARAGRAVANGLRRQLQTPAESLHDTVCRLLQVPLPDDQKELLQSMLENTLLIQTALQESPES